MKRKISILLAVCLLLTSMPGFVLAEGYIDNQLLSLENQRQQSLKSIKEQLEEQDMMVHYELYENLINEEFNSLKKKVEGELTLFDIKYPFDNGGQIRYRMEPSSDSRSHAQFVVDSFTRSDTSKIIREYDRGRRETVGDFCRWITETLISLVYLELGPIFIGIEGGTRLRDLVKAKDIERIENSETKSLQIVSVSTYVGNSTVWKEWVDNPNVYIPENAVKVMEEPF